MLQFVTSSDFFYHQEIAENCTHFVWEAELIGQRGFRAESKELSLTRMLHTSTSQNPQVSSKKDYVVTQV